MGLYRSVSNDYGETWSDPAERVYEAGYRVAADGKDVFHVIQVKYNSSGKRDIQVARSTDFGESWSDPVILAHGYVVTDFDYYHYTDYYTPSLAADSQGNWLAAWGTYSYSASHTSESTIHDLSISYSHDHGESWSAQRTISHCEYQPDFPGEEKDPSISTDGQGNWLVLWVTEDDRLNNPGLQARITSDSGDSWTKLRTLRNQMEVNWSAVSAPLGEGIWVAFWKIGTNIERVIYN